MLGPIDENTITTVSGKGGHEGDRKVVPTSSSRLTVDLPRPWAMRRGSVSRFNSHPPG